MVAAAGLVSAEELSQAAASGGDSQALAEQLVSRGLLTRYQMTALLEGRGASLKLGNYDILDRIGAGGMGAVFKARHRRMKRVVAVKVLAANLSNNPLFVKRFQREVETIACLGHPNIVMAYDADEAEAGHFLVMEFVNGLDLAAVVSCEGPLSLSRAVNYTLQTARGMAYAHSQGIIHRDIKPHNLLLDASGVVKITDLGLARLSHGAEGAATGADVTMAGGVIGTADYMSPEQALDSTTIDHRADIYSLGCTLYFLLTGHPPYEGPTIVSILLKHRDGDIPRLDKIPHLDKAPAPLDDLFRKMLAKQPEQRIQQMSEVAAELEAIAALLPPLAPAPAAAPPAFWPAASQETTSGSAATLEQPPAATLETKSIAALTSVLIVEPSRVQAAIIKSYLEGGAFSAVGTATSGETAIQAIRSLKPRAVISAMHLSDMNGVELARRIRTEFQGQAPGFVLITSEDEGGDSSSLSKLHRVLTLHKPFTAVQLNDSLNLVSGASVAVGASGRKSRGQLRVLIVDDSATARLNVRSVLQGLGFSQFLECPDGAHAIAVAAREICDLIVTDYNMPLMDGRALVSYLKQNPATAAIPILMVTTETEPRLLDPVRKLGVVAIVEKAFPASVVGPLLESLF